MMCTTNIYFDVQVVYSSLCSLAIAPAIQPILAIRSITTKMSDTIVKALYL